VTVQTSTPKPLTISRVLVRMDVSLRSIWFTKSFTFWLFSFLAFN